MRKHIQQAVEVLAVKDFILFFCACFIPRVTAVVFIQSACVSAIDGRLCIYKVWKYHLCNTCPGRSVITSRKSRGKRENSSERQEGSRDRWRTSGEGSSKKRRSWRADLKYGWKGQCWRGGIKLPPKGGVDLRKSSLLDLALPDQKGWLVSSMAAWSIYHCATNTFSPNCFVSQPSQRNESHIKSSVDPWIIFFIMTKRQMRILFILIVLFCHLWQMLS